MTQETPEKFDDEVIAAARRFNDAEYQRGRNDERERLRKVVEGMKITDKLWLIEPENKSYNAALDAVLKELD